MMRQQSVSLSDFIHTLPKAELHLHLEGSVDAPTLVELSRRHNTPLPFPGNQYKHPAEGLIALNEAGVAALYQYKDFQEFLMAFKAVTEHLRDAEDYELITYRLMQRLHAENVSHAEVYVSVGVVHWRGQEFLPLFEGLERGRKRGERDFGGSLLWIFDAVRHFGAEAAQKVLDDTLRCRALSPSVIGFGIGGDERRGPPELFKDIYSEARVQGLRLTAHAGETAGPESVWGALNIGAERIGHGLHAASDAELVAVLVERQVPLEICVTSNLRTQACPSLQEHPLKSYFEQGCMVTLNTDDPTMFATSLTREFELAHNEFGFTREHLRELARNSFEASFLPPQRKLEFLRQLDAL
jgi:aminodeoxyfutalosine deaminase